MFKAGRPMDCAVAGYEMRALGKGSLAAATRDWDDPFRVAVDAQNLVSRRYDPIRLFNGASNRTHYSVAPDGQTSLVQLVSFATRPPANLMSLRMERPHRSVALYTLDSADPVPLRAVRVEGKPEYQLPQFFSYAALEVKA
jgi:hypothetical protein